MEWQVPPHWRLPRRRGSLVPFQDPQKLVRCCGALACERVDEELAAGEHQPVGDARDLDAVDMGIVAPAGSGAAMTHAAAASKLRRLDMVGG